MTVILEPTPTTGPTTDPRVLRGAELLDRERPGWWRKINLDKLDIQDCENCVLGQLDGDWQRGCDALGFSGGLASARFGFAGDRRTTRAWADLIYARRRDEAS